MSTGNTASQVTSRGQQRALPEIADDEFRAGLSKAKTYTAILLRQGPRWATPERETIIWAHGRRNYALRAAGVLPIVCPALDDSTWCGLGIFDASEEETARIMDGDPAVQAGVLEYELHPIRTFPGDQLPE